MTQELTTQHTEVGVFLPPDIVLQNARTAAKALADVIHQKPKPVIMNGEQYLEFDDWQLVGQFYGYTVRTGDAVMVEIDGVKGAKASASLIDIKTGMIISGAEAYCMRDEDKWNTRPKYEWQEQPDGENKRVRIGDETVPWFQLASMAQTRAGAKALRNRLAWVVVLAGYRATPAEEIQDIVSEAVKERRTIDKSAHFCAVHNINYFKKGRMKNYAHPIEGTKEWCNEPDLSQEAPSSTSETTKSEASKAEGEGSIIKEEKQAENSNTTVVKELYALVKKYKPACKSDRNVEAYLSVALKIDIARLKTEPEKVLEEVKSIGDWK